MHREGVAPHGLSELVRQQRDVQRDVAAELAASGIEVRAGGWGQGGGGGREGVGAGRGCVCT